jgi:hypothetical protein
MQWHIGANRYFQPKDYINKQSRADISLTEQDMRNGSKYYWLTLAVVALAFVVRFFERNFFAPWLNLHVLLSF